MINSLCSATPPRQTPTTSTPPEDQASAIHDHVDRLDTKADRLSFGKVMTIPLTAIATAAAAAATVTPFGPIGAAIAGGLTFAGGMAIYYKLDHAVKATEAHADTLEAQASNPSPAAAGSSVATPTPLATPKDDRRFKESSQSGKRDLFLGGLMGAEYFAPHAVGQWVGIVGGPLAMVSGFGELREGMKSSDAHQAIDGTIHMIAGGLILAGGLYGGSGLSFGLALAGGGLLAVKSIADHPSGTALGFAKEGWSLTRDSGAAIAAEFKGNKKPTTEQQ